MLTFDYTNTPGTTHPGGIDLRRPVTLFFMDYSVASLKVMGWRLYDIT